MKREIEEPDLWETIGVEKALAGAAADKDLDNSPFSEEERKRINQDLIEIKNYLLSRADFGPEQKVFLEERFRYLAEASQRLGRKDWMTVLLGGLLNVIVGLALAGDKAGELMRFAGQVFHWLVTTQYFFPAFGT